MFGITFSALPRAFACRLSTVLPRVDQPSEDARAGTVRHRFFQVISEQLQAGKDLDTARAIALEEAPEDQRQGLEAIPVETLGLSDTAAEVAVAFDVATGEARELGRGIERRYAEAAEAQGQPLRETELVGTLDRLGFIGASTLRVCDFKGRSHRRLPSEDAQLLAGALAASRIYGRPNVELEIARVIDGEVYATREQIDILEVDTFETRVAALRTRIEQDRAAFVAGDVPEAEVSDHCSFCPSMRYCPAQFALARAVLGEDSDEIRAIVKVGKAYMTPQIAVQLHGQIDRAEKILEILKEARREFARASPYQLPDGRWYGVPPESKEREILPGPAAAEVLGELFGAEAARAGTKVEVTLGGVEAAAREFLKAQPPPADGKKPTLKSTKERAEQLLTERGLLRITYGGKVRLHKREV